VFARAARRGFRVGRSRRERIDAFLYTCSPLVFLVSSLLSFGSLALFAISGTVPAALLAWLYGLLGSQLLLAPLVVAEAALTRDRKVLWLIPGLYVYWMLQLAALIQAAFRVVLRPGDQICVPDPTHRIPAQAVHRHEDVRRAGHDPKAVGLHLGCLIVVAAIAHDESVRSALEPNPILLRRRGVVVEARVAHDDEVVDRLQIDSIFPVPVAQLPLDDEGRGPRDRA